MRTDGVVGITEIAMVGFESQKHDISTLLKRKSGTMGVLRQKLGNTGWAMVWLLGVPLPLLILACLIMGR